MSAVQLKVIFLQKAGILVCFATFLKKDFKKEKTVLGCFEFGKLLSNCIGVSGKFRLDLANNMNISG
ncbi:hypothetical protein E3983_02140 [Legionella israelensis]|uniref:Uncharacterized protein n=1 Tax=Legionella israelensis TaxID=454 RepID=A0AAX1EEG5_9GAMM|nr:hypothetical protein [Legionella israelensis]QBR83262.1 hypothetical protein E3983_02140 [Legionella israelensis]QBS09360.1 hypothetical protein E4T55_05520 [Legionella israelensis]QDP71791.1 hypothetical protein FOG18_03990 [Legionella israelensis]